jgi:ribosome-binding factor A
MSNKNFSRMERVEREITALLSSYFISKVQGEFDFLVSLTTVKVTKDLRNANAYVSIMGTPEDEKEVLDFLKHERREIQLYLGKSLRTKYVPKLQFFADDTYAENFRIMGRLKDLGFEHNHEDLID